MTQKAQVLPTHTPELFRAAVQRAATLLRAGEVVALPTETVYGLAANAFDSKAVAHIFEIKRRPAHNPLIVHVANIPMAHACALEWPTLADRVTAAFWPGPLTIVLPRSTRIPNLVTAGGSTVGIRWPSHPFIQAVIRQCDFPLAAPSANASNQLSPTNAAHVFKALGDKIRLIVDGGQSQVGIESTVLDISLSPPRVLRPGMIHEQSLLAVTGELFNSKHSTAILKSPGQLPRHYAPKAKLLILSWKDDSDLQHQFAALAATPQHAIRNTHLIAHTHIPSQDYFGRVAVIPHDPEAFARAIYAELHQCDEAGAELVIIEAVPETLEWNAVRDRLTRAAAE